MRRRQQCLDGDGASPLSRLTCAIDDFNDSREHGIGGGVREGQPQRQEAQAAAWCGVLDGTISTRVVTATAAVAAAAVWAVALVLHTSE